MHVMSRFIALLALWAFVVEPCFAEENMERTISVSGQGTATSPPDMATIETGVVTQASEASPAVTENNQAVKQIMDALKQYDIASKDIQTSRFNIQPLYKRDPRGQQQPEIVGYQVTNQVRVHVRNLPQLGEVLDAVVRAGSNQVQGIAFGIDDDTGVLNQARNRAVADARSRAELYAHAAGVHVGRVISISEQDLRLPQPVGARLAMAESVPIATGEQEVQATVHMVFALEDAQ